MPNAELPLAGLKILFGAATFPNRTQPWVLSWIIEAIRQGADPEICAFGKLGTTYQSAIDELRLLDRTTYLQFKASSSIRHLLASLVRTDESARRTRHGVRAMFAGRSTSTGWLQMRAKNLAMAPLLGLRDVALIHSHAMHMSYHLLAAADAWRVPLVMTFHGLPPPGVQPIAPSKQAEVYERGSLFLVNTDFAKKQLAGLGCPAAKIAVLPQGTDLAAFPFVPLPHPGSGSLQVLTVGRLHADKGHRYMIRAVAQLAARGRNLDYHIVGIGPERARLERLAADLDVARRVHFHGEVDDAGLRARYATAHVFVLPSVRSKDGFHEETQGVVLQEAQASGKLVIATRTGGIPECMDDGRSAVLVPDSDSEALASAMERLLDSPADWPAWQNAGREWVAQRYSMPVLGARVARLYREVLAGFRR